MVRQAFKYREIVGGAVRSRTGLTGFAIRGIGVLRLRQTNKNNNLQIQYQIKTALSFGLKGQEKDKKS